MRFEFKATNVHLFHGDGQGMKQALIDFLIEVADCDLIVGDFNCELCLFTLPSNWARAGPYVGFLYNLEKLSLVQLLEHDAFYAQLSDHWFFYEARFDFHC